MNSLRRALLILVLFLAFAYNIERLDFDQQNVIDIQSFVYVLLLASVTLMVGMPFLRRFSVYTHLAFWVSAYFALRLLVFNSKPLIGGLNTYLTLTELFLLLGAVVIAYELLKFLNEMETVIEKVTFPSNRQRVPWVGEAAEDIKTEFVRSRRYKRPLSLVVIQATPDSFRMRLQRTVQDIQRTMLNRYLSTSLALLIVHEARRTDMVLQHDQDGRFLVLCPETTSEGVQALVERVQESARKNLDLSLKVGASYFPNDAQTFEEMLQQAELSMDFPLQPAPAVLVASGVQNDCH